MSSNRQQQGGTTAGKLPVRTLRDIAEFLERVKPRMEAALPRHLTADRLIKVALTAISRNPRVLECTPESLALALMEVGQLGLEPHGPLGHAYLVPYRNKRTGRYEVQFQPGYRGLMELARRSGCVDAIEAHVVYEGDDFYYERGLQPKLVHKPCLDPEERGELRYVYAIAWPRSGSMAMWEVMSRKEIEAARRMSQSGDDGAWVNHYDSMARKTVIKRLCKYLPQSPELAVAIAKDDSLEAGEPVSLAALEPDYGEPPEPEAPQPKSMTRAVKARLSAPAEPAPEPATPEPENRDTQLAPALVETARRLAAQARDAGLLSRDQDGEYPALNDLETCITAGNRELLKEMVADLARLVGETPRLL